MLFFFAWMSLQAGVPTLWSPLPFLFILPLFIFELPHWTWWGLFVLSPLTFALWNPQLFAGRPRIPLRTVRLLVLLQPLNWLWIIYGFSYSCGYHGKLYTVGISLINIILLGLLVTLFLVGRSRPHFLVSLVTSLLAWTWLTVYLFPYMGELP